MSQLVVPNEGELELLKNLVGSTAGGTLEDWTLKLFRADYTPVVGSTGTDFTEANFSGYAAKTLTRTSWGAPSSVSPSGTWVAAAAVAESVYAAQTFTMNGGATGNTIYGYYIVGASSGKVIAAEKFDTARVLAANSTDSLTVTPKFGLSNVN
jgi:hypothetical protein